MGQLKNKIRQTINNELKDITTIKLHDNNWEYVNVVVDSIQNVIDEFDCAIEYSDAHYEGCVGELGNNKTFEYVIIDIDGDEIMDVRLVCSFCGTNDDPMGAYDITVLLDDVN